MTDVIQAFEKVDLKIPVVVRLAGTSVEKGRKLLKDSGLPIAHAEALFNFPGPVLIFHQLVAAAMNGEEIARMRGIRLDLLTQPHDEVVYGARDDILRMPPHLGE